jgi:hypothetical protein
MSGLFDKLQNELDNRNEEGVISPLDLLDLPDELRRIMREMLRAVTMSRHDVFNLVESWPEKERLERKDLKDSLNELVRQGWLIEMGEGDLLGYRVNLRRKKGSTLSSGIWSKIDTALTGRQGSEEKDKPE